MPIIFTRQGGGELDIGLEISFTEGIIEGSQPGFIVGMEDYEGFHVWRGTRSDGSDMEVIAEISKEEAFIGQGAGGSPIDQFYFYEIIPELRTSGVFNSPFSIDCLGYTIEVELEDNEFFWFDCSATNGFTYYYMITNFDRGYGVASGRQGLVKTDLCQPSYNVPLSPECRADLFEIQIDVDEQDNLNKIYAVPNPFRTGGSRLTTSNYHNFPDNMVRFVNVPLDCRIKIFTVAGDIIWEHTHNGPAGNIEWDTRNRSGEEIASGVYVYKIEDSGGGQVYGRLIVIR